LSQWDGPQFQPPYPPSRQSSWALPVILVLVGVLGIIGIGYGVLKVTRPQPTSSEGLPTGDEPTGVAPGATGDASQVPDDAAHSMPSAPTLLGRCRADGAASQRAAAAKATFRVAFRDTAGYAVWIGTASMSRICTYRWDGTPEENPLGTLLGGVADSGYLTGSGGLGLGAAGSVLDGDRRTTVVTGWVSKDVSRVQVKWAGSRPPTEAVLNHQYVLVRLVDPDQDASPLAKGCEMDAYNAAGDLVGHKSCGTGF
jgi:hypothetical protein